MAFSVFICIIFFMHIRHGRMENHNETLSNGQHAVNSTSRNDTSNFNTTFPENDDGNYLKETTKIVMIKIYPPPAKNMSNQSFPAKVRIAQPFGLMPARQSDGTTASIPTTKRPAPTSSTTMSNLATDAVIGIILTADKELAPDFNYLCRDGPPYMINGSPIYCSKNSGCPQGYWCHTGSSKANMFCCPNAQINSCNSPIAPGHGDGRMERWYFDANDSVCKLFIYTGYGGNQNNFLTNQECVDTCAMSANRSTLHPTAYLPAQALQSHTTPAIDHSPKSRNISERTTRIQTHPTRLSSSPFGKTYIPQVTTSRPSLIAQSAMIPNWGQYPTSWGQYPASFVPMVPSNPSTSRPNPQLSSIARCRDVVNMPNVDQKSSMEIRWYYDYVQDICKPFSYSGQDESSNNFRNEYECNFHCRGKFIIQETTLPPTPAPVQIQSQPRIIDYDKTNPCDLPPNAGHGYMRMERWYFDAENRYCQLFFYSGQGGNMNNFENEEQCLFACVLLMPKPSRADPCELPKSTGHGMAALTRFYFNSATSQCETFLYSGEGGNRNNFFTWQECRLSCPERRTIAPPFQPRPVTPGAIPAVYRMMTTPMPTTKPTTTTTTTTTTTVPSTTTTESTTISDRDIVDPTSPFSLPFLWESTGWPEIDQSTSSSTIKTTIQSTTKSNRVHPCKGVALPEYTQCGPYNHYQCPVGMYCHVGSTASESVCCPTRGKSQTINICTLPIDSGSGTAQLTRWRYNSQINQCEMFMYKGTRGNQNNFLTFDMCMEHCGVSNPCAVGSPLNIKGQNVQCSTLEQSVCPETHYCHVGADMLTSVCCPRHGDPCAMSISIGSGKSQLQRWAFNSITRSCQTFIYTGMGGNENNFITEADCIGTCQAQLTPSNPCNAGRPAKKPNGIEYIYCSTSNLHGCPESYYCHIGGSPEATLCCPLTAGFPTPCELPLNTGTGSTELSRWYFDSPSSACKPFIYTGMTGNENNFLSLADCRQACPEFDNPCPGGTPPSNPATGQVDYCSAINPICPPSYWCHIGGDRQSSVCCPFAANPCAMPRVEGTGRHELQRFYFDRDIKQCRVFMYTGSGGNQNNFLSLAECEAACPTLDNPCGQGSPALGKDGTPIYCSTSNQEICPDGYWCHIGSGSSTTLCCPDVGDPCSMPAKKGTGASVFNRWHYNKNTKTCVSFTYSARGGNQNNFLSLTECRAACPEFRNPCSTGQPHIGLSGKITRCGPHGKLKCPVTYWCHVGVNTSTSVCCPGAGDPCELPVMAGNGHDTLERYYYDTDTQECRLFQYSGMGGNENNFLKQKDCEARCPVFRNPCSIGDPLKNEQGHTIQCSVSEIHHACPVGHWCHVGMDEQATVCCQKSKTAPCDQPMEIGNGSARIPRYYYNNKSRECFPFTYSGAGGNENNFLSRLDCEKACPGKHQDPCPPSPASNLALIAGKRIYCNPMNKNSCPVGFWCHIGTSADTTVCCPGATNPCNLPQSPGRNVHTDYKPLPRWFYDLKTGMCIQFQYAGLEGNQNNFLTLSDCQTTCASMSNFCPRGDPYLDPSSGGPKSCTPHVGNECPPEYFCHGDFSSATGICCLRVQVSRSALNVINDYASVNSPCQYPVEIGHGIQVLPRWYFDWTLTECRQYIYSGLGGNENNFLSIDDCRAACQEFFNPCGGDDVPLKTLSGRPIYCNVQNLNVCPKSHYCHVGAGQDTTMCCPIDGDICKMPPRRGKGSTSMQRWYFDSKSRQCKIFTYKGIGGNANNFLNLESCEAQCGGVIISHDKNMIPPRPTNACIGEPYRISSGHILYCDGGTACPEKYYCHFGNDTLSTMCCPSAGDPCSMLPTTGVGQAKLQRWFFNTKGASCVPFLYTGLGGNENNFRSMEECEARCAPAINPCEMGTLPYMDPTGRPLRCTYADHPAPALCPPMHFCHVGLDIANTVCCPIRGVACDQPKLDGRGSAIVQRWYFDAGIQRCVIFMYTGSGGNANNFLDEQDCMKKCGHTAVSFPMRPPFWSHHSPSEKPSMAKCPHGEPLMKMDESLQECSKHPPRPCPHSFACFLPIDSSESFCCPDPRHFCLQPISIGTNLCQSPMIIGPGQRFGYDQTTSTCIPFYFEGCGGHLNNFATLRECMILCSNSHDPNGATSSDRSIHRKDNRKMSQERRQNIFSALFSMLRANEKKAVTSNSFGIL